MKVAEKLMNLLDRLKDFSNSVLLFGRGKKITGSKLCELVAQFRDENAVLKAANVVVAIDDWLDCVVHLVALDGWARGIHLVDPTAESRTQLIDSADATIGPGGVIALSNVSGRKISSVSDGFPSQSTSWYLRTSGTTGEPKTIEHSLESLTRSFYASTAREVSRWCLAFAPYRFAGLQVVLQSLCLGQTLVVPDAGDVDSILRSVVSSQAETVSATPSFWRRILMHSLCEKAKLTQITLGGEIADGATLSKLKRQFPNARLTHIYASTEAGVGFSVSDGLPGFPAEWLDTPQRGVHLRISVSGNLLVKHEKFAAGSEVAGRTDSEGYFDTMDRVEIRGGRVFFLGRESGAINVGGNKVFPERVENVVLAHPQVDEVVVLSKRSSVLGQLVSAKVVVNRMESATQQQLKQEILMFCREHLRPFEVPASLEFVEALELAESGKIERGQRQGYDRK